MKPKSPAIPPPQSVTLRQALLALLAGETLTLRELSVRLHLSEREVLPHLEHLRRSGDRLLVTPASCAACGFVFRKRERLGKPGRCPVCRSEHLHPPRYGLSPSP